MNVFSVWAFHRCHTTGSNTQNFNSYYTKCRQFFSLNNHRTSEYTNQVSNTIQQIHTFFPSIHKTKKSFFCSASSSETEEMREKIRTLTEEIERLKRELNLQMEVTKSQKKLPLEGVKVLDLSRILAGPFCTQTLADFGAEIIKVEKKGEGDATRTWGPPFVEGESTYFFCANRNKKSIALDIRSKDGIEIIKQLTRKCDVVVENFVPGTAEKLGISYDDLRKENERIIYAGISGFGNSGPYAHRPGYDVMITAMGGMMAITGEEGGNPVKIGVALIDVITGLYSAVSIASCLYSRTPTSPSVKLELSLLDTTVATLINVGSGYLNSGVIPKKWGTAHSSIVPYQSFKTNDGFIVLGANSDSQWLNLCDALHLPDFKADDRYKTNRGRVQHRSVIVSAVQECIIKNSKKHWVELLTKHGISVCPINNVDEVFQDPHINFRNLVDEISHPVSGMIKMLGFPVIINEERPRPRSPPPLLGEHTNEVLQTYLGYTEEELSLLRSKNVI